MKITKAELIELAACRNGLNRFIAQTNNTDEPVEVSSLVGGKNTHEDLLWLAGKKLPKDRIVRFACDCALLNNKLIEPYTYKYDLIVEFLRNPTAARAGARTAARAGVRATACAATRAAGWAAGAADAAYAAYTSTYATGAAWAAGWAAGTTACAAAAENRDKVNELLRGLFA